MAEKKSFERVTREELYASWVERGLLPDEVIREKNPDPSVLPPVSSEEVTHWKTMEKSKVAEDLLTIANWLQYHVDSKGTFSLSERDNAYFKVILERAANELGATEKKSWLKTLIADLKFWTK